jgi:nicotinate-nucleotide adenylyltransferase
VRGPDLPGILLFGGSFDPIHHGHLIISRFVAEHLGAQHVLLIPAARPPHKPDRDLTPGRQRLAMCRLAVEGEDLFEVSDWELQQPGPNYTLTTVRHFAEALPPGTDLFWLVGMDSLAELASWYRVSELADACTVVTAARPGFESGNLPALAHALTQRQIACIREHVIASPRIEISATDIRARVRAGQSIRYLVPEAVAAYIARHGLYRAE